MQKPFFSIIVPIYNTPATYFEMCINSLVEQTFKDIEIILVDDGSKQDTASMCDQYAMKNSRIRVIHQQNQGVSAARNHGIDQSTADWIMFVDADDWIELDACERLSVALRENSCDMLLFNAVKEYPARREALNYGFKSGELYRTDDVTVREQLYRRAMGSPNTKAGKLCVVYYSPDKVFRRSFLMKNGLRFPVGLPKSEDKVFILSCFEKMDSMYYLSDALYHYRINDASVCNRYSETADLDRIALSKELSVIAERMDRELGALKGKPEYREITKEFYRFIFGIISDVLLLKYYHPDYPKGKIDRRSEAKKFLSQEPFASSISACSYGELPKNAMLKKFLLSHGMVGTFCFIKEAMKKLKDSKADTIV